MNVGKPPFNDVRVRKAVALAINKQDELEGVAEGLGEVMNQHFVKSSFWHFPLPDHKRDLDKAKALLKEAGYPNGLDVPMVAISTWNYLVRSAEIAQAQLAEIGMRVKLDISDMSSHMAMLKKGEYKFGTFSSPVVADPDFYYSMYFTPGGGIHPYVMGGAYNNPKVTELLKKGREVLDRNKRKEYYTEALRIINHEDFPVVWLFINPMPGAWRHEVKGYECHINHFFCYAGGGLQYAWFEK
jgi:ABC-type transport system substrate-binding protein